MRLLICLILILIIGCGTYTPKPTIKHVLAVTSEGDTLLLPIDKIRPNIYQSIYPLYAREWNPYYYNGWRYNTNVYSNKIYYESTGSSSNNNSSNISSNHTTKDISRIDMNAIKDKRNDK
jgi:hypothetical protein